MRLIGFELPRDPGRPAAERPGQRPLAPPARRHAQPGLRRPEEDDLVSGRLAHAQSRCCQGCGEVGLGLFRGKYIYNLIFPVGLPIAVAHFEPIIRYEFQ